MRFKFAVFTLSLLLVLTMSTGAFAQAVFTLSAGSTDRGRDNGHAELTGGITLFRTTGSIGPDDSGEAVIDYGVPITNDVGVGAIEVEICGMASTIDAVAAAVDVDQDDGIITITVDGSVTPCAASGEVSINVEGVMVSLVGSGATSVTATVSGRDDVRLPGGAVNSAIVITNVVDPLTDDNVNVPRGKKVELIRHTGIPSGTAVFTLVITEAHDDSFDGGQLELQFSGIPEGIEVTGLDAWVTTKKNFELPTTDEDKVETDNPLNQVPVTMEADPTGDPGDMRGSDKPAKADEKGEATVFLQSGYRIVARVDDGNTEDVDEMRVIGGELDSDNIDVVVVRGMVTGATDEDLLPIDLDIQVAVDLGPIGDEDEVEGMPLFASDRTTPVTIIESTSAQTKMSAPFAIAGSGTGGGGYDTGVAVANMGSGSSAQAGAITFDFYPATGEKMSHTTASTSPSSDVLNANGMLEPGGTYAVLLGQLFLNAGNGHLIITTDFTEGDANLYISDFDKFSATGSIRIVD